MKDIEPAETKLVQSIVKPNMLCLDIGANIGYYSKLMGELGAYVYAFEPEPKNYEQLENNTAHLPNVFVYDYAVTNSNSANKIKLYLCTGNYNGANGMHRIYKSKWCDGFIEVDQIAYDDIFLVRGKVDFIKMDIEGAELGALKGMERTLERYHPTMLIEFHPPSIEEYGVNPEDEYNFLVNLGYKITLVPDIVIDSYQQLDKLTRDESGGKNILCT